MTAVAAVLVAVLTATACAAEAEAGPAEATALLEEALELAQSMPEGPYRSDALGRVAIELAGISTVAGTVASVVSSLDSVTVSACDISVLPRLTVPVVMPPFSEIASSAIESVNSSKSVTSNVSLADS